MQRYLSFLALSALDDDRLYILRDRGKRPETTQVMTMKLRNRRSEFYQKSRYPNVHRHIERRAQCNRLHGTAESDVASA